MDSRYNIKIYDLKTRDRLKAYKKKHRLSSQEQAINHLLDSNTELEKEAYNITDQAGNELVVIDLETLQKFKEQ